MKYVEKNKFSLIVILIIVLILAFLVIKPFIITLLISAVLAFLFHPLYRWLRNSTKKPKLCSILVTTIIILIIVIPSIVIINIAGREVLHNYPKLEKKVSDINIDCDQQESIVCNLFTSFGDVPIQDYLEIAVEKVSIYIITKVSDFAFAIPMLIINFLIMIFVIYYLFIDGENFIRELKIMLPYKRQLQEQMFKQLYNITFGIVYGTFLIAIIEGIITWVAFFLAGISGALIWSIVIFVLAFIPMIGPTIIWIPATIILFVQNNIAGAFIVLLLGVALSIIDNMVRPKIIGHRTKAHPILILLGIIGGIAFLGIVGIIIGPLILSLAMVLLQSILENGREA